MRKKFDDRLGLNLLCKNEVSASLMMIYIYMMGEAHREVPHI